MTISMSVLSWKCGHIINVVIIALLEVSLEIHLNDSGAMSIRECLFTVHEQDKTM